MSIITPIKRYLPHELHTRIHAVKLYRSEHEISFVCRRYKVSKSSLLRWNKRYDGTPGSLMDRSHRPHTPHPNSHTPEEIKWVRNLVRRTPDISCPELWWKLHRKKGYHRHPGSLRRLLIRLGLRPGKAASTKEKHAPMPYDTPTSLGVKWQMDVKYVPAACYASQDRQKFYQYTMIDEAARKRFIYPYMEQSSASTCDFIRRAILFFKYVPAIIQTDNGSEFTYTRKTDRIHPMDALCQKLCIEHKLIRPRTPRHNGKVERSHRNDQERFYNHLSFYSYNDLLYQMSNYLYRSNRIPSRVLGWLTPEEMTKKLMPISSPRKAPKLPENIMDFIYGDVSV